MRGIAFLAPLALTLAIAVPAAADPASVTVTLGPELQARLDDLGEREVREQADRLSERVAGTLAREGALDGARVELVLTDLRPNRPTFEQLADRPGLDPIRSISIGGAAIEGQIHMADGAVQPVRYEWFSHNLSEVHGFTTWQDAQRAYDRLANRLARGQYVSR